MKSRIIWRALCLAAGLLCAVSPAWADTYSLIIAGTDVTDNNKDDILGNGAFSYNPKTKTLTVRKSYTMDKKRYMIANYIDGLVINVPSDVTLESTLNACLIENIGASITFTGTGNLTLKAVDYAIRASNQGSAVIFDNANVTIISGYAGIWGDFDARTTLTIRESTLSISISDPNGSVISNCSGGITLEGCEIAEPQNAHITSSTIWGENNGSVMELRIVPVFPEDKLFIDGTKVTKANMDDILDNGIFSFDPSKRILYVKDDYTGVNNKPVINNSGVNGLIISAEGATLQAGENVVFTSEAKTTFTGSLTMVSTRNAIVSSGDLFFYDADVVIDAGKYGMKCSDDSKEITIDHSNIRISSGSGAIQDFVDVTWDKQSVALMNPEGGYYLEDSYFCDKDGHAVKNLEMRRVNLQVKQNKNCTVSVSNPYPEEGETVMLTAALKASWFLKAYKVTDGDGNDVSVTGGTWDNTTATFVMPEGEVTVEAVLTQDAGELFVCVPKTGNRTIQMDRDWLLTGLKIHDDGGPKADYSANSDGTLTIMAPEGYVLQLTGIVAMDGEYEGVWEDYITIHDGATTAAPYMGKEYYGYWNGEELPLFESTGRAITIHQVSNNDISVKSGFTLTLTVVRRELLVNGTLVTDDNRYDILGNGAFSFDPGTYTLSVKGDVIGEKNVRIIENLGYENLTINVEKDATLSSRDAYVIYLESATTFTGEGLLTMYSNTVACVFQEDVTFDHANVVVESASSCLFGSESGSNKLTVKESSLMISSDNFYAISEFYGGIELDGCELLLPEEGKVQDGAIVDKDGNVAGKAYIGQPVNLEIAGTDVTFDNCEDILGNGLFSYAPGTKTLTVKGSYSTGEDWMISNGTEGLTINVPADATLEVTDEGTGVLGCYAATTFTGKGRLTMKAPAGAEEVIYVGNDVTLGLDHADIVVKGAKVGLNTYGDMSTAALDIVHSNLQAEGTQAAAGHFGGGISLTECELFFPSPGDYTNSRFLDKNGHDAKVVIVTYDIATGITERPASSSTKEPAYYDLSGRRIQRPQKGMYIVRDRGDRSKVLLMK